MIARMTAWARAEPAMARLVRNLKGIFSSQGAFFIVISLADGTLAFLRLGYDRALVALGAGSTSLFLIPTVPMVQAFGVAGAAASRWICNGLWLLCCTLLLRNNPRRSPRTAMVHP